MPGLYILGMILKRLEFIQDRFIPLILLIVGVVGTMAIMGSRLDSPVEEISTGDDPRYPCYWSSSLFKSIV
ncbi:phage holin family protein [Anaerosolibacter sp.]|uniref:phage holin family protein n=1 Tax=Anaerosolibacter sp. TaxID=1872527 RepID=UPI003FA4B67E